MAKKKFGSSQRSLCNKQLWVIIKSLAVPQNGKLPSGGKESRRSGAGHFQGRGLFNKPVLWRFIPDGTNDSCERLDVSRWDFQSAGCWFQPAVTLNAGDWNSLAHRSQHPV